MAKTRIIGTKMNDIQSSKDIETLVNTFYDKVQKDEVIGFIFNDVAAVNWDTHLPRMYAFWGSILLGQSGFNGNPMAKHMALDKLVKLKIAHFERWTEIWTATVDECFSGEVAEMAKQRAANIRDIMEYKVKAD